MGAVEHLADGTRRLTDELAERLAEEALAKHSARGRSQADRFTRRG